MQQKERERRIANKQHSNGLDVSATTKNRNAKNIRAKSGKRTREELHCIFGKDYDVPDDKLPQSSDSESDNESEEEEPKKKKAKKVAAKESAQKEEQEEEDSDVDGEKQAASDAMKVTGLQTLVSNITSDEYFRQKMLERKQRREQRLKQQEKEKKGSSSNSEEGKAKKSTTTPKE